MTVRTALECAGGRRPWSCGSRTTARAFRPSCWAEIFDPFFTTKAEGKGVGLGLAVVYGIVEAHDGEMEVQSTPGVAATFEVTLPLRSIHPPPAAQPTGAAV